MLKKICYTLRLVTFRVIRFGFWATHGSLPCARKISVTVRVVKPDEKGKYVYCMLQGCNQNEKF